MPGAEHQQMQRIHTAHIIIKPRNDVPIIMYHSLLSCGFPTDRTSVISLSSLPLSVVHPHHSDSHTPTQCAHSSRAGPPEFEHGKQLSVSPTAPPTPSQLCLFRRPSPTFHPSLLFFFPLPLISTLPFSVGSLNRMLILTGGFQSRGSSFSSRCALQVHQHKVTTLFPKKGNLFFFFLPVSSVFFSCFSVSSHKKQTFDSGKCSASR